MNNQINSLPDVKVGVKLPRTDDHWNIANSYFKSTLPVSSIDIEDLNATIKCMNETIYNNFKDNYGTVKTNTYKIYHEKYKEFNKHKLKRELKTLTDSEADKEEIKLVAKLLRSRLKGTEDDSNVDDFYSVDLKSLAKKNLWSYAKTFIEKKRAVAPTFDQNKCYEYFNSVFKAVNPSKVFRIPSWMPTYSAAPSTPFDLTLPSFKQITKKVRKMKASGSPCPLDQISTACFKHCPYLRSFITEVIAKVWVKGCIPNEWKKAVIILIHKGESEDPANFRPITLEPVTLKIFTACLRDKIFEFLKENSYIEYNLQKGCIPKLSGTFEHTAQMGHMIDKARLKQRSLIITLLHLINAFGEVHHNLISAVYKLHHIPEQVDHLVKDLYSNFNTTIMTSHFKTPFIKLVAVFFKGIVFLP